LHKHTNTRTDSRGLAEPNPKAENEISGGFFEAFKEKVVTGGEKSFRKPENRLE
jgi:hypothetical protein